MNRSRFLGLFQSGFGLLAITPSLFITCKEAEFVAPELSEAELAYLDLKNKTKETGFHLEGKILSIDLTHEKYSQLQTVGEFVNDLEHYILILRKSVEEIVANSNCCPHLGTINQWSYDGSKFRCGNHGNSYGTSGLNGFSGCSSGRTSGQLKQYSTEWNKDIVTIDLSS